MERKNNSQERLIRMRQVKEITGLSVSYIYSLASAGKFPQSISLVPGGTSRAWLESEVQDWIKERVQSREVTLNV